MVNWAIVIGINNYTNLQPLKYAKRDAEEMKNWFVEARFDKVFLFTEDSLPIPTNPPIPTLPTFGYLRRFLRAQFENPLLQPGDNLWFFFAGHGIRESDKDYLMLLDSDPGDVENTAISVDYITQRLRRCGADNVVLFLDACRNLAHKAGLGIGEEKHQGVITFYSCKPQQKSWEIDEIRQGSFTWALLEGLRIQGTGNCATVERLDAYLSRRVPEINQRYRKALQNPYAISEPLTKSHLILLPKYATLNDLKQLKLDAHGAEIEKDWKLAFQLWFRVNIAAGGTDLDAIKAFVRIENYRQLATSIPSPNVSNLSGARDESKVIITPPINLISPHGVNFQELDRLLISKQWKDADIETGKIMCKIMGREREGWLTADNCRNFPPDDLYVIDQLWLKHSHNKFGFSIQKQIWLEQGGKLGEYNYDTWCKLGDEVGWRKKGDWLNYNDLTFNINAANNAPKGHLPMCIVVFGRVEGVMWVGIWGYLFSHL